MRYFVWRSWNQNYRNLITMLYFDTDTAKLEFWMKKFHRLKCVTCKVRLTDLTIEEVYIYANIGKS